LKRKTNEIGRSKKATHEATERAVRSDGQRDAERDGDHLASDQSLLCSRHD